MGAGTQVKVDPKDLSVSLGLPCVWLVALLLGDWLLEHGLWLLCSWLRVLRCMACSLGRGCLGRCFHLGQSQSGDRLLLQADACTNGTLAYRVGAPPGSFGRPGLNVASGFCLAWGATADALRLS